MNSPKNILMATDFSLASWRGLEVALLMAGVLRAKVHLVHAFTVPELASGLPPLCAMQARERLIGQKLRALVGMLQDTSYIGYVHPKLGEPAPSILLAADVLGADLIVMGAPRNLAGGTSKTGRTVECVLRRATQPVLVAAQSSVAPFSVHFPRMYLERDDGEGQLVRV